MVRSGSGPTTMPMSMSFSFCWSRQLLSVCCSVVLLKLEAKEVGFSFSQLKHDIHVFPGISMNTKIGQLSFKKNEDVVKSIYLELRRGGGCCGISDLKSFLSLYQKVMMSAMIFINLSV